MSLSRLSSFFGVLAITVACQAPAQNHVDAASGEPPATCTKLGASCTFSPGKLGSCVEVERIEGPAAFVCQSQH
jgi:hypothetical protein